MELWMTLIPYFIPYWLIQLILREFYPLMDQLNLNMN